MICGKINNIEAKKRMHTSYRITYENMYGREYSMRFFIKINNVEKCFKRINDLVKYTY